MHVNEVCECNERGGEVPGLSAPLSLIPAAIFVGDDDDDDDKHPPRRQSRLLPAAFTATPPPPPPLTPHSAAR